MAKTTKKPAAKKPVARPNKVKPGKNPPTDGKPPVESELLLDQIDPTPAESVRAGYNEEYTDRYAEAYERGDKLPPIDVFGGFGKFFLGDGGHRRKACLKLGRKKVVCLVRAFASDDDAFAAALRHAAGSNESHGLNRTNEDKRAAVSAVIGRPEYETASDTAIGELCKVGHVLVRLVREKLTDDGVLTGKAASTARGYKPDASIRGGAVTDGKGNVVKPAAESGRATSQDEPATKSEPEPTTPKATTPPEPNGSPLADQVRDGTGRVVPPQLMECFRSGRQLVRDTRELLGEVFDGIQAASGEEWGKGLPAILTTVEAEIKTVGENVGSSIPAYLCPHTDDTGTHVQPGNCKVCHGRGWLSRHVYRQLPDPVKQLCKDRAGKDAVGDETTV